jgi:hypothetical protein
MLRLPSQLLAHLDPVQHRHHHVKADKVRFVLRDGKECRPSIDRLDNVVTVMRQKLAQKRQGPGLVVDGEDQRALAAHGSRSPTRAAKVVKSIGLLR